MGLSSNLPNIGLPFKILVLLFLHVLGASSLYSRQQQLPTCHGEERAALLQFKESFAIDPSASIDGGAYPKVSTWKSAEGDQNRNCCSWDGVECDENTGHVTRLDLSSSCLHGSINSTSSLFRLVHLRSLNLADNNFSYSQIPTTIGNLSRLRYLNLSSSMFSGQVPSKISQLSKLVSLDLSGNLDYLSGERLLKLKVPILGGLVQNLTSLEKLRLSDIIISSTIPDSFANLSFLSYLALDNCDLVGEFPIRIFRLQHLKFLSVRSNQQLSGYLPEFNRSSSLSWLSLEGSNFSRTLPTSIGELHALEVLNLGNCSFSGPIPASLSNLTQLEYLVLGLNNFVGGPLSWLGNKQTRLATIDLEGINLSGRIPSSFGNLTQLSYLSLSNNELSGPIPCSLGNLTRLIYLEIDQNSLNGEIPESLFNLVNLYELSLFYNELHGNLDICKLPSSLTKVQIGWNKLEVSQCIVKNTTLVPKLTFLGLPECNIKEFPNFVRHQQNLTWLDISGNKLHGQIPIWMWNTSTDSLEFLDLSSNFLSGFGQPDVVLPWVNLKVLVLRDNLLDGPPPMPAENIAYYRISDNRLTGELSPLMCNLTSLQYLDLGSNKLSGTIPQCLGNFSDVLQVLDLRNNTLCGSLPETYSNKSQLKVLDVSYNQLYGKLPRSLANCVMLESFVLSENKFSDVFPIWLGNFPELKLLALRHNEFYGVIEDTKENLYFPELRILDMSYNNFSGEFPAEYIFSGNAMRAIDSIGLHKPAYMLVSSNLDIASGTLFGYYFRVTITNKGVERYYLKIHEDIGVIDISSNNFHGKIPEFIGNLKGLRFLNISNNFFTGSIPSVLENLTLLESLDLSQNQLSGEIPPLMCNLTSLLYLDLSSNKLSGTISQCLGNFSDVLQALDLRNNTLRGSLPETYSNKSQLNILDVSYNQLHGKLPRSLANLTSLQYLDLSNNKLSGTIPQCLGNFSDVLLALNLQNNTFRGSLPETYSNKSQLKMLDVSYNQLHGKLPRSLENCVMLESLVLSENKFSDVFPIWLGHLPELKLLALSHNEFYGVVEDTKENLHFSELRILDISYNNFTGEFPTEYIFSGNAMRAIDSIGLHKPTYMLGGYDFGIGFTVTITNKGVELHYSKIQEDLRVIDISSNNFHGKIPEFIGNLKGLRILNISNNIFTGSIPSVLENLTLVESLDLSQNQLSGEIPQQLAKLTSLAYFSVSYNNLTGSIPQGPQFQTFENTSFEGNPGLCGDPLIKRCQNSNPTAQLPPSSSIEETEVAFELDWKFVLAGVVSGLVVGVVLSDVVITRKRELFLDIVGMMIRQMKRIRRHLRTY